MEAAWVSRWFLRLLELKAQNKKDGIRECVYVADRSPFSAALYVQTDGTLLETLIKAQSTELESNNIRILTVYIRVRSTWFRACDFKARSCSP
jgi:hypothetical protein